MDADQDESKSQKKKTDVVLVHSPTKNRDGYHVVRARDGSIEVGEMHTLKEGEPIRGEVVKLKPRQEHQRLFDVEVVMPQQEETARQTSRSGPAQVSNNSYRQGWEAVFKKSRKTKFLN